MSTKLDPVKATPYMSVVEGRRPRQKVHTSLGHAKNAFDTPKHNKLVNGDGQFTHGWGAIFEHIDGDWVQIYEIAQPTEKDFVPNSRHADRYETRPWRTNDNRQPLPAVRTPAHQEAEPAPGSHPDVEGILGGSDERGRTGDHQRASGSSDDLEVGLIRQRVADELTRTRLKFEHHKTRYAERGFQYDMELMLRFEGRMYGLMWVVERMPDGTVNTKSAE